MSVSLASDLTIVEVWLIDEEVDWEGAIGCFGMAVLLALMVMIRSEAEEDVKKWLTTKRAAVGPLWGVNVR